MESETPPREGEKHGPAATEEDQSSTTQRGAMASSPQGRSAARRPGPGGSPVAVPKLADGRWILGVGS